MVVMVDVDVAVVVVNSVIVAYVVEVEVSVRVVSSIFVALS